MSYGASPNDWLNFDLLGIGEDLLPVVSNPNAEISAKSTLKQLGKVPSRYNANRHIAGVPDWTAHKTTPKELQKWSQESDYGICIQTRRVRALDVDVNEPLAAEEILAFFTKLFPARLQQRHRANSSKFLIPFILEGVFSKRVMKVKGGIIEFLANGQQFVAVGTHPSGTRYEGLENIPDFPEITAEQFESFWKKLAETFAIEEPSTSSLRNPQSDSVLAALNDPVAQYLAELNIVTGLGKEGQHFIKCPFSAEHTEPEDKNGTATAYLPAGNRDYEQGHFACLHAHCHNRPDEDFLDALGYRARDFDILPPETSTAIGRFDVVPAGVFAKRPETSWLIKGILPEKGFFEFYGGSGDGKTFVCLDMMLSLCRGLDWNGHRTQKKCRVVYICAEGAGGFISRLKAYAHHYNVDLSSLDLGIIPETPNFRNLKEVELVAEKVNAFGAADVVIVDTLAQVTPGADENTGKDMSIALRHCDTLRRLTNAACGLVHHAGKDVSKGARGWSGLKAPLDAEFSVLKNENGKRTFWVEKLKDARDGFGFEFELLSVVFDKDADGDDLDSCVVNYLTAPATKAKNKISTPRKMGTKQELAYNTFMSLGNGGEVLYARLIDAVIASLPPVGASGRAKKKSNVARTIETLIENGELSYDAQSRMLTAPL